jgi:hypothetical protein
MNNMILFFDCLTGKTFSKALLLLFQNGFPGRIINRMHSNGLVEVQGQNFMAVRKRD